MPAGWELIATSGIVLIAGIIVGLAGFGFALFAVPPPLFVHDAPTVVALVNILGFSSGLVVLYGEWDEIKRPILRSLLPSSLAGLIVGTAVLRYVDGDAIELLASVAVVVFAVVLATGAGIPGVGHRRAPAVAGLASGVLGTSAGLPGPPIALLFTARDLAPTAFRVTITGHFVLVDVVAVALLALSGRLHRDAVLLAGAMVPPSLVGRWIGRRIVDRVSPPLFRRIVVALLLLTGTCGALGAALSLR